MQSIFDGHNDTLLRLWQLDDHRGKRFLEGDDGGHIDLPRARRGGLSAAFFAIFPPASKGFHVDKSDGAVCDEPPIGPVDSGWARVATFEMAAILLRMCAKRPDAIRLCRTVDEIELAEEAGAIASIMHIEGAEAIGEELGELEVLYAAGLRSIGPVWSRPICSMPISMQRWAMKTSPHFSRSRTPKRCKPCGIGSVPWTPPASGRADVTRSARHLRRRNDCCVGS